MINRIVVSLSYHYVVSLHLSFLLGQFLQIHFDAANERDILYCDEFICSTTFHRFKYNNNKNNDANNDTGN